MSSRFPSPRLDQGLSECDAIHSHISRIPWWGCLLMYFLICIFVYKVRLILAGRTRFHLIVLGFWKCFETVLHKDRVNALFRLVYSKIFLAFWRAFWRALIVTLGQGWGWRLLNQRITSLGPWRGNLPLYKDNCLILHLRSETFWGILKSYFIRTGSILYTAIELWYDNPTVGSLQCSHRFLFIFRTSLPIQFWVTPGYGFGECELI